NRNLRTEAFAPEPHLAEPGEQEHNGMVGVARGQTVRLNVINLADGSVTPDPCQMSMSLLDSRGGVLLGPIDVTLDFGESAMLDLNGNLFVGRTGRAQVRSELAFADPRDPTQPNPCSFTQTTVEVFDTRTGKTSVIYAHSFDPQPDPPGLPR